METIALLQVNIAAADNALNGSVMPLAAVPALCSFFLQLSADGAKRHTTLLECDDALDGFLFGYIFNQAGGIVRVNGKTERRFAAHASAVGLMTQHSGLCAGGNDLAFIFGQRLENFAYKPVLIAVGPCSLTADADNGGPFLFDCPLDDVA
jgi:hypothetical protein